MFLCAYLSVQMCFHELLLRRRFKLKSFVSSVYLLLCNGSCRVTWFFACLYVIMSVVTHCKLISSTCSNLCANLAWPVLSVASTGSVDLLT